MRREKGGSFEKKTGPWRMRGVFGDKEGWGKEKGGGGGGQVGVVWGVGVGEEMRRDEHSFGMAYRLIEGKN